MIQLDKFLAGHYEEGYGYKYFVPNLINDAWEWKDSLINHLLEKAALRLGELNSFSRLVPNIDLFIQLHVSLLYTTQSPRHCRKSSKPY